MSSFFASIFMLLFLPYGIKRIEHKIWAHFKLKVVNEVELKNVDEIEVEHQAFSHIKASSKHVDKIEPFFEPF